MFYEEVCSSLSVLVKGGRLLGLWRGEGGAEPLDSTHSNLHSRKSIILQVCGCV